MNAAQSKLKTSATQQQRLLDEKDKLLSEVDSLSDGMMQRTPTPSRENSSSMDSEKPRTANLVAT